MVYLFEVKQTKDDVIENTFFCLDWTMIRRVLIRARQQFGVQSKDIDSSTSDVDLIEVIHLI